MLVVHRVSRYDDTYRISDLLTRCTPFDLGFCNIFLPKWNWGFRTLLNLSPYALMPAVLNWYYSGPSLPPFPSFLWLQAMGCSPGKHEHELQERYGSRIYGDFDVSRFWRNLLSSFPWDDDPFRPPAFRVTPCLYLQHLWTVRRMSSTTVRSDLVQLRISCIRSCNIVTFYTRKILKVSLLIFFHFQSFSDPELWLKFWKDPWEETDNHDTTLTCLLCPVRLERMAWHAEVPSWTAVGQIVFTSIFA